MQNLRCLENVKLSNKKKPWKLNLEFKKVKTESIYNQAYLPLSYPVNGRQPKGSPDTVSHR